MQPKGRRGVPLELDACRYLVASSPRRLAALSPRRPVAPSLPLYGGHLVHLVANGTRRSTRRSTRSCRYFGNFDDYANPGRWIMGVNASEASEESSGTVGAIGGKVGGGLGAGAGAVGGGALSAASSAVSKKK